MSQRTRVALDERWAVTRAERGRGFTVGHEPVSRRAERRADTRLTALGLALSVLFVGAMAIGSQALVLVAALLAMAASLVSPIVGVIVLAFVAPLPRPLVIPPPGVWIVMGVAIVIGLLLRLPIDRPALRLPTASVLPALAFVAYLGTQIIASVAGGFSMSEAYDTALRFSGFMTGMLMLGVAAVVLRDRSPYPVIAAVLASAAFVAVTSLLPSVGLESLLGALVVEPDVETSRANGYFLDPNYFGAYLAAAATLAVACATIAPTRLLRLVLLAVATVVAVALLASLSRGGIVALAAGLVAVAFTRSPKTGFATLIVIAIVAVAGYPLFADARFTDSARLAGASLPTQLESGRVGTWVAGLELFSSSPLFGIGFGNFVEESLTGISAHNWYVAVLAEGGVVGLTLWALFVTSIVLVLRRRPRPAQIVGFGVLVAWCVASLFVEPPRNFQSTGVVVFSLAAALTALWAGRDPKGAAEPVDAPLTVTARRPAHSVQPDRR